ncbi:protein kinase family protein [Virgibacillus sp. DJP39]|uniref:protein kinase family protein n=1 Tax=Virgibacillus sp. DJP39 TaxID=3409790 RepID=UPI003BB62BA8
MLDLNSTVELANSVRFKINKNDISVSDKNSTLELIGAGRSAVVFKIQFTDKALKVFFPNCTDIAKEEAAVYKILEGNPYYPTLYEAGENFLLIDYIEGDTLFECLSKGIKLTQKTIKETDYALFLAREAGLNPSDIHLRNIILTPGGKVKLIDVARFRQVKDCQQWTDLKKVFFTWYNKTYFPKKIPVSMLNTIAYLYKKKILYTTPYKRLS